MGSEKWSCVEGQKEKRRSAMKKKTGDIKLSTDPQSVAARERRHRISERFKILQSMVPGGTKMDTVSMLDEAIHYVKFLKTQIWLYQAAAAAAAAEAEATPLPLILPFSLPSSECPITTTTPTEEDDYTSYLSFSPPPLTFPSPLSSLHFQGVVDEDEDDPPQLSHFPPPPFI